MDVKNIRFSITQVAVILIQLIPVVWFIARMEAKIRTLTEVTEEIREQQKKDLIDLKVRVALLESKIKE